MFFSLLTAISDLLIIICNIFVLYQKFYVCAFISNGKLNLKLSKAGLIEVLHRQRVQTLSYVTDCSFIHTIISLILCRLFDLVTWGKPVFNLSNLIEVTCAALFNGNKLQLSGSLINITSPGNVVVVISYWNSCWSLR